MFAAPFFLSTGLFFLLAFTDGFHRSTTAATTRAPFGCVRGRRRRLFNSRHVLQDVRFLLVDRCGRGAPRNSPFPASVCVCVCVCAPAHRKKSPEYWRQRIRAGQKRRWKTTARKRGGATAPPPSSGARVLCGVGRSGGGGTKGRKRRVSTVFERRVLRRVGSHHASPIKIQKKSEGCFSGGGGGGGMRAGLETTRAPRAHAPTHHTPSHRPPASTAAAGGAPAPTATASTRGTSAAARG